MGQHQHRKRSMKTKMGRHQHRKRSMKTKMTRTKRRRSPTLMEMRKRMRTTPTLKTTPTLVKMGRKTEEVKRSNVHRNTPCADLKSRDVRPAQRASKRTNTYAVI